MDRERERAGVGWGVGGVESMRNPGTRRLGWRRRTQSDLVEGDAEEEAAEEGEAEGTTPTDIDRTPNQKKSLFSRPLSPPPPPNPFNGGGHTFSKEGYTTCCKSCCLKHKTK